ncbi:uncharacterized protein LOC115882382 [Sitophilus oryzae]|uniref:Uncharacterized protein LOC115882382 n=1 Tax=Sitophilus oryzae TaxID=7048 RepID=A0A6J2XZU9_SITOR|nr:uncharacterized protein LOC115882382 [Sitophilus oryzae]
MKTYLFILMWVYIPNFIKCIPGGDRDLNLYLNKEVQLMRDKIYDKIRNIREVNEETETVKVDILGRYEHSGTDMNTNSFTFLNKTYLCIRNEIFLAETKNNNDLKLTYLDNFVDQDNVVLFRAIEYKQESIIVQQILDNMYVFTFNNDSSRPEPVQEISTNYVSDALLFVNEDNLYLAISTHHADHIASFTIYKWLETHFDELDVIYTTSIEALGSFSFGNTEIIIALQSVTGKKTHSSVFEFKSERITKIQYLNTHSPIRMDVFIKNKVSYVLVYEEYETQLYYKWNGFQMVLINTFHWTHNVDKSVVVYDNLTPLIVIPQPDKALVYIPKQNIILQESKKYTWKFSVIINVHNDRNENSTTFIVGLSQARVINIYAMSFKVPNEIETEEPDALGICFNNLDQSVYGNRIKINQMNDSFTNNAPNNRKKPKKRETKTETDIENKLRDLKIQLDNIRPFQIHHENVSSTLIINLASTINSIILTRNVEAKSVDFKNFNGKLWKPETLFRINKNQNITGPVQFDSIYTKILIVDPEKDQLFKNLLLKNGKQRLLGRYKINSMSVKSMTTQEINGISIEDIYIKSNSSPVQGRKTFRNVFTHRSNIAFINNVTTEKLLADIYSKNSKQQFSFASNVVIENLIADSIDKINWQEFINSVYRIGENLTIKGNFTVPNLTSKHINARYINEIDTTKLMTKTTNQVINATIQFNNIRASDIQCNTTNDIDIADTIPLNQNGTIINGPVILNEGYVTGDLELLKLNKHFYLTDGDRLLGTNESDLRQIYTGKVVINGNMYIESLNITPNTTIFINGNEYILGDLDKYWTKNTNQSIPVHFEALNGISIPHLTTIFLDNISLNNFAINRKNESLKGPLSFENAYFAGNVTLNETIPKKQIDLKKLSKEGVRNDNKTYHITGKKNIKNVLNVNHLTTKTINGQKIQKYFDNLNNQQKLKKLIIKGDLISDIEVDTINKINLSKLKEDLLPINQPLNISKLEFKHITVENLYTNKINGYNINETTQKLQEIILNKDLKTISIKGNLTLHNIQNVTTINHYNIEEFLKKDNEDLPKNVKFPGKTTVCNLRARIINKINFPGLTNRLLYRKSNQTISGHYTFDNLKTKHLYVNKINDINVENLTDITYNKGIQTITVPYGIILRNTEFKKSLEISKMFPCNIQEAVANILNPQTREWKQIEIIGNASILDEASLLGRIMYKTIKKNEENTILAPVYINGHVLTDSVKALDKINDVNLTALIEDAVLSDADEEQEIAGKKLFSHLEVGTANVLGNTDTPILNRIRISQLYKSIIKQSEVQKTNILGKKVFFGGLQTDKFSSKTISGINPEQIVDLTNVTEIPYVLFETINVLNNLEVESVNSYNLSNVLQNRILTNVTETQVTNAILYFTNLEIKEGLKTVKINDIDIKNVVFDIGEKKVSSPKMFEQDITILGNASIGFLNGINITEAHTNALMLRRKEIIKNSVTFLQPVEIQGDVTTRTINHYPLEQIKEIMNNVSNSTTANEVIYGIATRLRDIIVENIPILQHMPNELMYIEKSDDLQIKIKNTIDARVTVIEDYALIHIVSEEVGDTCFLPKSCKCPVQYTIEISPQNSVSHFLNKQQQRVYSYDDGTITIHFTTTSISTDSHCRTDNRDYLEMSTMTWSTRKSHNSTGSFNIYPSVFQGYISGVEFFSIGVTTYAVIARYYDPAIDSHDLDCTVIKFSEDKSTTTVIQKIPTKGVWSIYVLYTAQGVILVVGNIVGMGYTEIFKFNVETQKFEMLRRTNYVCKKAVGVVLQADSLLILSNEDAPLQILKYNAYYNNYYYYQGFFRDGKVTGMSVFYVGGFGISDAYLTIITENNYKIYSFQYIDGWKLESSGNIKGLRNLIPFEVNDQLYLFAPSEEESSLLSVIKHGAGKT